MVSRFACHTQSIPARSRRGLTVSKALALQGMKLARIIVKNEVVVSWVLKAEAEAVG